MKRFSFLLTALFLVFAACSDQPAGPSTEGDADLRKAVTQDANGEFDLKDRYIVVFRSEVGNVDEQVDRMTRGNGSTVHFRYRHAIKGFCATIPPQAVEGLRRNPNVAYIEPDGMMYAITTQYNVPSWGIDRIDQASLPLSTSYTYNNDGAGVTVYIIDTGILYNHVEFGGRASFGMDVIGTTGLDENGHGTHVAGTVGGANVGVAKGVTLKSIRVLNKRGSGTTSGVIAGVDWVTANHAPLSVANMSLGGGYYLPLNQAVAGAVTAGVTFVVAAGNESTDASTKSPASEPTAITVGATTSTDGWAYYSNYGTVVDILAPGSSIYSAYKTSTTSYATMSGTSMASPHVAGVAALYKAANPGASPSSIENAIKTGATANVISGVPANTTDDLVYSLIAGGGGGGTAPAAPTTLSASAISSSQINLTWTDNASDESGFYIERFNGTAFVQIATVGADATSFSNTGLNASTLYQYRVRAFNSYGNSAYSNIASATTSAATPIPMITAYVTSAVGTSAWVNPVSWAATLTVEVMDASSSGAPVSGATVAVSWANGSGTGITNSSGVATVTTGSMNVKKITSVSMTINSVTGSNISGYNLSGVTNPVVVQKP
jgi:hypothetical protein